MVHNLRPSWFVWSKVFDRFKPLLFLKVPKDALKHAAEKIRFVSRKNRNTRLAKTSFRVTWMELAWKSGLKSLISEGQRKKSEAKWTAWNWVPVKFPRMLPRWGNVTGIFQRSFERLTNMSELKKLAKNFPSLRVFESFGVKTNFDQMCCYFWEQRK